MKSFVVLLLTAAAVVMMAMPLAVVSFSTGAPRCLFVPAGHTVDGKIPDFTP